MPDEKVKGTVKHYDAKRGFGFIGHKGGKDVYVHQREVERAGLSSLSKGDSVTFTLKQTNKGYQAEDLEVFSPLGADYLSQGYFYTKPDDKEKRRYLRPEVLDSLAIDIAQLLGDRGMNPNQLRRFFNKARGIEAKLSLEGNFEAIKADLYGFKRDAAYQVGRKVIPQEFQVFIERNIDLAVQDEESFKGFLQHFESVLAYFVYLFRE